VNGLCVAKQREALSPPAAGNGTRAGVLFVAQSPVMLHHFMASKRANVIAGWHTPYDQPDDTDGDDASNFKTVAAAFCREIDCDAFLGSYLVFFQVSSLFFLAR
jgi:hypothetical protein